MESSDTSITPQSISGPLQKQEKSIRQATRSMTLPEKSTRPLKKRRVVSIEDYKEQKQQQNGSSLAKKQKARKAERAAKKQKKGHVSPSPPSSPDTVTQNSVTWNGKDGNMIYVQHPNYDENDVWFTRENYREFLLDRLHAIKSHRYMAANNVSDDDSYCIRGLELFQDETTSEQFQSKKKIYYSTIKMEQMRQGMSGIKDPERFRVLVEAQSDLALHRAHELAAQDMHEAYPFRAYSTASKPTNEQHKPQHQNPLKSMSVSSFSDMQRLRNMMESIYGSPPSSLDSTNNNQNNSSPNPLFKEKIPSSFGAILKTGAASVVSDVSSTSSSRPSDSGTIGQPLFTNESIRKLQQRSMRRLMGIYQNNNEEGTEGTDETKSLFKFARKDSLLGMGKNSASRNDAKTSSKNSVWAVPEDTAPTPKERIVKMMDRSQEQHEQKAAPPDDATSILQERIKELMHQRQIQEKHYQQEQQQQQMASSDDATSILQERITELMHQRQFLYETHHQQQQQQAPSSEYATPSLQDHIAEMMHRRKILEDHLHHQQQQQTSCSDNPPSMVEGMMEMIQRRQLLQDHHQQQTSPAIATTGRSLGDDSSNPKHMIKAFLIQQQQHQQEHQKKMQLALMAMNKTSSPIRRDTLRHVHTDESSVSRHPIPWNVTSMA